DTVTGSITGSVSVTVNPAAASTLVVTGYPSPTTPGTSHSFTVTARDAYGNNATGYVGSVNFTSSDAQAVLPANYAFTSSDAGTHTFSATFKTAGGQSITATDTASGTINGSQTGITVKAAAGSVYYVSLTGSDNNPGTLAQPFGTINHGASILTPGDTLYIRAGTYAEQLVDAIPSGTSWTAPVTISAYPGETVIMEPSSGTDPVLRFETRSVSYIEIDNLVLDARNLNAAVVWIDGIYTSAPPNHIRLRGDELRNSQNPSTAQGLIITGKRTAGSAQADYNEIINCKIHDINTSGNSTQNHGMYIESSHNLIDGNE